MNNELAAFVEMRLDWVTRHLWNPAHRPQEVMPGPNKLWLMRSGGAEVTVENRVYHVKSGMVFLTAAHHRRTLVVNAAATDLLAIGFHVSLLRGPSLLSSLSSPVLWKPSKTEYSALESWMLWLTEETFIKAENNALRGGAALEASGLSMAIFSLCWRHLEKHHLVSRPHQSLPPWISAALEHVRLEPSTSVAQWARVAGFSPAQFRRLFGQWMGVSPQEYLARHRLDEARRMLAGTDISIGLISQHLGFSSPSHFTRRFKTQTGLAPARYRFSLRSNVAEAF